MNELRHWLFDDLGLKLVALLLGVLVYLNAYTDRPASMTVLFRVQVTDLGDSLSLSGSPLASVQAELRGTGKQLIRLRVTEPAIKVSLAGVAPGHFERVLTPADLPLPHGAEMSVERMSPQILALDVERRLTRRVPVAARLEGEPAADAILAGSVRVVPDSARVSGPESVVGALDSLPLQPASIAGKHDVVEASVEPELPGFTTSEPTRFAVRVPLAAAEVRRMDLAVRGPSGASAVATDPPRITAVVTGPRALMDRARFDELEARWSTGGDPSRHLGRRVPLTIVGAPAGVRVVLEPDSVTLVRAAR
jgi:hypothetical protein